MLGRRDLGENDQMCIECMLGVKDVKKFIEDYRKTIRDHMKMVCDFLHVAYASKCRNKVIHSIDAVIDELVYYSTPQMVCQRLGLCDNTDGIQNIKYPDGFMARSSHRDHELHFQLHDELHKKVLTIYLFRISIYPYINFFY